MAYITFNDGTVRAVGNDKPNPGNRFASWTPFNDPKGDASPRAADGRITMLVLRRDYGATFEVRGIPSRLTDASSVFGPGVNLLENAARLVAHLREGGICSVFTEDLVAASYDMTLAPGSTPSLAPSDSRMIEFTLSLSLRNLAAATALCRYR